MPDLLDIDCTIEDVLNACNDTIWYSLDSDKDYPEDISYELCRQLTLRGL